MHEALRRTSDDLFNLKNAAEQHVAAQAAREAAHSELGAALAIRLQGEEEDVQHEQMQLRRQKQDILASEDACHRLRLDLAKTQTGLDLQQSSLRPRVHGRSGRVHHYLHTDTTTPNPKSLGIQQLQGEHALGDFTEEPECVIPKQTPRPRISWAHAVRTTSGDTDFKSRSEEALGTGAAAAAKANQKPCLGYLAPRTAAVGASSSQTTLPSRMDESSPAGINSNRGQHAVVRDTVSSHTGSESWAHEGFAEVARNRPESWFLPDPGSTIPPTSMANMPSTPSSGRTVTPRMSMRFVTALNAAPPSWQHPLAPKQGAVSSTRRVTAKLQNVASSIDRTNKARPPATELDAQKAPSATASHAELPKTRRVKAQAVHVPCSVAIKDGPADAADDCFWTTPSKPCEARMAGVSGTRVSQTARVAPVGVRAGTASTIPVPLLTLPAPGSSIQTSGRSAGVGGYQHAMWTSLATPPSSSRNSSRWDGGAGMQGCTSFSVPRQSGQQGDGHGPMWVSIATPPNSKRDHATIGALSTRKL